MSRRALILAVIGVLVAGAIGAFAFYRLGSARPLASTRLPAGPLAASPATDPGPLPLVQVQGNVVYLHYYMWWTQQHWHAKLGPSYPYSANPPPIPGRMDGSGCNPQVGYPKADIVDVPSEGLYNQDQPGTFNHHVELAAGAGVTGFLASWQGTGETTQNAQSSGYNTRLDALVKSVDAWNQAHPDHFFGLGLAFASFGDYGRPADQVTADLQYFTRTYGHDAAFRNPWSGKPAVMWLDSRKYTEATVAQVSRAVEPDLYLLGDETAQSWARDAAYLDGTSYYWSSENPATNPSAGASIISLGEAVRAQHKRWFAPVIAGYDKQLDGGGSCIPRNGLGTIRSIWALNARSHPDGWFGISWNEFVENTYLEPSRAYGTRYLDELSALIKGGQQ
jgi:hypothetical protein